MQPDFALAAFNQKIISQKVYILTKYLPKIIFSVKGPLKITEAENSI